MKQILISLMLVLTAASGLFGQAQEPFKLGTFEDRGEVFLGLILRDSLVVHIARANAALDGPKPAIPSDMKGLILRYEDLRQRLYFLSNAVSAATGPRPAYVRDVKSLKILPPVSPTIILNAAVNYTEHGNEMQPRGGNVPGPSQKERDNINKGIPGIWERKAGDTRQNPYLFLKAPSAVIGDGEAIRIPPGREQVDWECELSAVIGRPASHVPAEQAADYIFGWTMQNDVSDRGSRADGRHGTDWFLAKSHDTFAPVGPFIVPKEFVKNPMKLSQKFILSGKVMQDSNTDRMTHSVYEMVSFASSVITLKPGDLVSMGSPAGVGAGRDQPLFMKNGDTSVCTIESIGTLTNPVIESPATTVRSK
jgi:2-keto-4-pentenoate hydratase/2-oxohepta-3-ene-1,7-dioic acid hydratase in catechol pathway